MLNIDPNDIDGILVTHEHNDHIKGLGTFSKKYNVPVPSLAEQELIVKNLDKFDKLINDISEGIPAEIEARRKQYDYYRNKLLSFEELNDD